MRRILKWHLLFLTAVLLVVPAQALAPLALSPKATALTSSTKTLVLLAALVLVLAPWALSWKANFGLTENTDVVLQRPFFHTLSTPTPVFSPGNTALTLHILSFIRVYSYIYTSFFHFNRFF